jgi:cysteine-rich repeat protein
MTYREKLVLPVALILGASCAGSAPDVDDDRSLSTASTSQAVQASVVSPEVLAERAKLAKSGRLLVPSASSNGGGFGIASAETMLAALDIPAELNPQVVSLVSPHPQAAFDTPQWGILAPRRGGSFVVLSTGQSDSTTVRSEPGVDFGAAGIPGDAATFTIQVNVPPGVNRFTFDYNFLSAEYPDFIGSAFNDTFTVRITDAGGTRLAFAPVSVNSAVFQPAADTLVGPDSSFPFRLYVDNALGVDTVFDNGGQLDAGITDFQRVDVEVAEGPVTIELDIRDLGDGILDSAVILDNFSFATVAVLDLNPLDPSDLADPARGMIDPATSRITTDLSRLATGGRPIIGVAADGVTQVLLRSAVPGDEPVTFSLSADLEQGGLAAHDDAAPAWTSQVTVTPVLVGGKHYAFALYRAPANYDRPGNATDPTSKSRAVTVTAAQAPMQREISLDVVRRPVVVMHDMWSSCTSWTNANLWKASDSENEAVRLPDRNHLHIECIDYLPQKGLSDATNQSVMPSAIVDAITVQRERGVAATQVDVIGHGFGGLLARMYMSADGYRSAKNFGAGDVNRFLSINTPHRGARMACEITEFRRYSRLAGTWENAANPTSSIRTILENAKIFIDDGAPHRDVGIDELRLDSAQIRALTAVTVPTHALFSKGGLLIPATTISSPAHYISALNLLDNNAGSMKVLYPTMMGQSWRTPINPPLPAPPLISSSVRARSLFGKDSVFFCPSSTNTAATAVGVCGSDNGGTPEIENADTEHDFFATVTEQRGGLAIPHTSAFQVTATPAVSGRLTTHSLVNTNGAHSAQLALLLSAPLDGGAFAPSLPVPAFEPCPTQPSTTPSPAPALLAAHAKGGLGIAAAQDLVITSPTAGTPVTPGGTVHVTLDVLNGFEPELILVLGDGQAEILTAPPYEVDFTIPAESIGSLSLQAMAFSVTGELAFSEPVTLPVSLTTTLNSIQILGGDVVLDRPGKSRQLKVLGVYSDGVKRDLSTVALGTTYTVSNAGPLPFAMVSPTGVVTALRPGDVTISAANSGKFTSVSVRIGTPRCGDAELDDGEQCDDGNTADGDGCSATCQSENHAPIAVCANPSVCNDPGVCQAAVTDLGAASTDPDGDLLSFGQAPAGPYGVGEHAVTVTVSDGELDAQCESALDVNDCEAPQIACPADFEVECTGSGGATVTPPSASATDNCSASVTAPGSGFKALGQHALAYSAADAAGNTDSCEAQVTVRDTVGAEASATGTTLAWPPIQDYRTVDLSQCGIQVVDACTGTVAPTVHQAQINCVTSDELDDAPGWSDGMTSNDIVITGPTTVKLRAEHDLAGDGRLYNIYFKVYDTAGNVSQGGCEVRVKPLQCPPGRDSAPGCVAGDSGGKFSVCR